MSSYTLNGVRRAKKKRILLQCGKRLVARSR